MQATLTPLFHHAHHSLSSLVAAATPRLIHAWNTVTTCTKWAFTLVLSALPPPLVSSLSHHLSLCHSALLSAYLLLLQSAHTERLYRPAHWLPALRSASRVAVTRCLAALPPDKAVAVVKAVSAARGTVGRVRGNVLWVMYGGEYGVVGHGSSPERGGEKEREERGKRFNGGGGGGGSNGNGGGMMSGCGGNGSINASPGMGGDRVMGRHAWHAGTPAPDAPWMNFGSVALMGEWIHGRSSIAGAFVLHVTASFVSSCISGRYSLLEIQPHS